MAGVFGCQHILDEVEGLVKLVVSVIFLRVNTIPDHRAVTPQALDRPVKRPFAPRLSLVFHFAHVPLVDVGVDLFESLLAMLGEHPPMCEDDVIHHQNGGITRQLLAEKLPRLEKRGSGFHPQLIEFDVILRHSQFH